MGKTPYIRHIISRLKFRVMKDKITAQDREPANPQLQCQVKLPCRILVVDHDPYLCHLSAEVLIRQGFVVNAAEDGKAGWEELRANTYNLLITEPELPKITGVKLVRKLREARITLPVVMATAVLPSENMFVRYPWLQPAALLLRPYSIKELLGTVSEVLRATDSAGAQVKLLPDWRR
jgi:DNA-binding response OmpR family regulator